MGDYSVVADAGQSIINVLWEEIQADAQVNALITTEAAISLESPADLAGDNSVRISIYLYRIVEDPYMKNRFQSVPGSGGSQRKPPLSLDLYYLVTPMVGAPRDQQIMLGKVMQVLYDRAILEGPDLAGTLATANQQLRVMINPVSLEETTRVWQALEVPYRLSVCYVARVAMVDSRVEEFAQPVLASTSSMQGN
jgi:Pvc16 N-terminal domain